MNLTVVSSLDALCRQQACEALAAAHPAAAVVVLDLVETGTVIRRTLDSSKAVERHETALEHSCLSCTVRLDLVPAIEQLLALGEKHIIVGLPSGAEAGMAISALRRALGLNCEVGSAIFACAPDSVEDHIWDHHTLFESGFTAVPEDERTPGEFLIGELSFCDTVLAADPGILPVAPEARARGLQLLRELAPHADVAREAAGIRAGQHDYAQATGRTLPGTVRVPADPSAAPFTTVTQRILRPLHPERFRRALATLAEGCCWLRGQLWIATAPHCRIAVHGVGPRIWLENTGPWPAGEPSLPRPQEYSDPVPGRHSGFGSRGTVLAATGDDLDAEEIGRLLASCQLTDAELAAGAGSLSDPFGLARQQ